jgi:hypothetical protein
MKTAPFAVAKDIVSAGGSAEAAEVDALDEQAVDKHLQSVIDKAGRFDRCQVAPGEKQLGPLARKGACDSAADAPPAP